MRLLKKGLNIHPAALLLVGSATFWGLNFHEAKIMLRYVHFIEAGFWRYLFGVGFLFLLLKNTRQSISWQKVRKEFKGVFLVGFIGLFLFNLFLISR